jgi:hypothetical protein
MIDSLSNCLDTVHGLGQTGGQMGIQVYENACPVPWTDLASQLRIDVQREARMNTSQDLGPSENAADLERTRTYVKSVAM